MEKTIDSKYIYKQFLYTYMYIQTFQTSNDLFSKITCQEEKTISCDIS